MTLTKFWFTLAVLVSFNSMALMYVQSDAVTYLLFIPVFIGIAKSALSGRVKDTGNQMVSFRTTSTSNRFWYHFFLTSSLAIFLVQTAMGFSIKDGGWLQHGQFGFAALLLMIFIPSPRFN